MTNRDLPVGENSRGFFAFGGGAVRKNADGICENLSSREDYTCGRKDRACGREDRARGRKNYVCGREGFTDEGARSAEGHDGKARRGGGLR